MTKNSKGTTKYRVVSGFARSSLHERGFVLILILIISAILAFFLVPIPLFQSQSVQCKLNVPCSSVGWHLGPSLFRRIFPDVSYGPPITKSYISTPTPLLPESETLKENPNITSTWQTYTDRVNNFIIKYPKSVTQTESSPEDTYIPICNNYLVCLLYPESMVPKTDFVAAGVFVSKLNDKNTSDTCYKFDASDNFIVSKVVINGNTFYHQTRGSVAAGHQQSTQYYRSLNNNTCLEIGLRITTETRSANLPPSEGYKEFTPVQEAKVTSDLNQILSTFQFTK
ncbi:hypothetical protein A3D84_05860 [Candidatus Woesebacteria bacterium RIFCSPHIGHO2_02_FULL_42_20]|uniref:Uncharacterized protein n=1 Tax=Candidatus Woesebacteria bacterium RIFCSPHIGHO2_12_FULL_41_24 TaxID=1802510 RepID=A0A1F8AUM2_9BACT|nr:MAG: hypothetical protein A2W15_01460 [Candidatus Woesebacteria bacterium RBG_16_41_13]OGM29875.1 MAG: hypothetical protein A2873_04210 [Candidatus Woesebacteria bacterium RIFCSPHIGHO2_01_FULL_42_80]OGM35312.1 MAG: hypothetical protein A3D84_05860 [Candidatus Woesebacteria bacterium RIFCSPHIGHO2_02_FULL_42_20]OGM54925.1 MAG: hypothetical protein A3E44_03855 [Candidatus Woesebacteria bacterium RIFCSPHIGHO2_12_FULL_41_24]OGM67556.1 MAG: hypothetical protein A2969_01260 [Candidatus Woesebacteri